MPRRPASVVPFVVLALGALGCGGAIEADAPGPRVSEPPDSTVPTEPSDSGPGSVRPSSAPRATVERGRTLFDLGIVTPLCMTRTGQHFLYLRRDSAGSAELRHLDLARSTDSLLERRTETDLIDSPARIETPLGAEDLVDGESRTRCATDALGEHAVVHIVAGELLRVALASGAKERFAYDTSNGRLSTLSISADAKAILFTQEIGGARYLDTTTGSSLRVREHFAEPPTISGSCVFRPYTGIHYPAGVFQCQNGLNGGHTYVLRDGVVWPKRVRAHGAGTSIFLDESGSARLVDLRTGSATTLGSTWVDTEGRSPRLVSESPLRVLWFDPYTRSKSGDLVTPSGPVPLPYAGRIRVAGPTSALGYAHGENGDAIMAWSYGAATPPTARTVAELPGRAITTLHSLAPDDSDPSTALVEAQCTTGASCSPESLLVRSTGEVERVGPFVGPRFAPRVEGLAIVTYADPGPTPNRHVGVLDARQRPHRLYRIATRTSSYYSPFDIHEAGTRTDAKVLVVDDEGCLRSTDLDTRISVELEALVRTRHGLGRCVMPTEHTSAGATVVARGRSVRAAGLLFPQQGNANYRVLFVEP